MNDSSELRSGGSLSVRLNSARQPILSSNQTSNIDTRPVIQALAIYPGSTGRQEVRPMVSRKAGIRPTVGQRAEQLTRGKTTTQWRSL